MTIRNHEIPILSHKPNQIIEEVNNAAKKLFGVPDNYKPLTPDSADRKNLYGKEPKEIINFNIGGRKFGAEFYISEKLNDKNIWVAAQHGYAGKARDFSKLAELLNRERINLLSLDMHIDGKDDFEKMSMKIDEWADVAVKAPQFIKDRNFFIDKLIFLGQSSGGSSGAEILIKGKENHPYDACILIGPTLITPEPNFVAAMDNEMDQFVKNKDNKDVMLDWKWLAPLLNQMHNKELNLAYQSHFTTTPGFPYYGARESYYIPADRLIKKLKQIDVPTILVKGEYDEADKTSLGAAQEELLINSNNNIEIKSNIKEAGHQVHIEKPEEILVLVEEIILKKLNYPLSK